MCQAGELNKIRVDIRRAVLEGGMGTVQADRNRFCDLRDFQ